MMKARGTILAVLEMIFCRALCTSRLYLKPITLCGTIDVVRYFDKKYSGNHK